MAVCGGIAALIAASGAHAETLTADRSVQIALQRNSSVIQAQAGVLDARSGLYGAYSRVLPSVSASLTRSGSGSDGNEGTQLFGSFVTPSSRTDDESYSTIPALSGSWSVLDLSALRSMQSARSGMRASQLRQRSTRQDVALSTRTQFYEVVKSIRLNDVASSALRLARDDERRVRALFEVGSVSRSDVLKAQVRTAQSQLDSLRASQTVTNQRIALAQILGLPEQQMGDVDTTLAVVPIEMNEAALRIEAASARPDLMAADAEQRAARANLNAANLARLPALTVRGSMEFDTKSSFSQKTYGTFLDQNGLPVTDPVSSGRNSTDRSWGASVALTLPLFTGMATESRIASAQARMQRANDTRDVLWRNLDSDVQQAALQYRQAVVQAEVARQAVASAEENLKLTQQKYNVGSATILDLIDAQVQLQRVQSDAVSALAGIRVAEAQLDRVRGRNE
ncbi:MAG: TolC family protein [Gemmatimonadaceae bacterium]